MPSYEVIVLAQTAITVEAEDSVAAIEVATREVRGRGHWEVRGAAISPASLVATVATEGQRGMAIPDVATALGVSRQHVYRMIQSGRLRAVERAPRFPGAKAQMVIMSDELDRYVREHATQS